jgi:hypothetical protein
MTTDTLLTCACCGAAMTRDEAAPAPDGTQTTLYYHARFDDCVRVALAHLAVARPMMRAYLGAPEEAEHATE